MSTTNPIRAVTVSPPLFSLLSSRSSGSPTGQETIPRRTDKDIWKAALGGPGDPGHRVDGKFPHHEYPKEKPNEAYSCFPSSAAPIRQVVRRGLLARLWLPLLPRPTASGALYLVGPTAPVFADTNQTLDFGVVAPGSWASQTANFVATATGSVSPRLRRGIQVADLETYHMQRERVDVDPGELPPGMHPKPLFEEVRVVDQHVDGSGPLDVATGQHFTIYVDAEPTPPPVVSSSARSAIRERVGLVKRTSTCSRVMSTCRSATRTSPSPRAAPPRLPVTVQSLGGPPTDVTLDLWDAIPGITILDPVVHVGPWQTVTRWSTSRLTGLRPSGRITSRCPPPPSAASKTKASQGT